MAVATPAAVHCRIILSQMVLTARISADNQSPMTASFFFFAFYIWDFFFFEKEKERLHCDVSWFIELMQFLHGLQVIWARSCRCVGIPVFLFLSLQIKSLLRRIEGHGSWHLVAEFSGLASATCAYDVYCLGKVLLELVTGKLGISGSNDAATNEWLEKTLPYISINEKELVTKILDPSLVVDDDLLEEVWAMAIVARSCLNPKPSRRPLVRYILKALENPLKVVREEPSTSARLRTTSSRGSWNAALFGSWRQSSSDITSVPGPSREGPSFKLSGTVGSQGSNGEHSFSRRKPSKEIFPEPSGGGDLDMDWRRFCHSFGKSFIVGSPFGCLPAGGRARSSPPRWRTGSAQGSRRALELCPETVFFAAQVDQTSGGRSSSGFWSVETRERCCLVPHCLELGSSSLQFFSGSKRRTCGLSLCNWSRFFVVLADVKPIGGWVSLEICIFISPFRSGRAKNSIFLMHIWSSGSSVNSLIQRHGWVLAMWLRSCGIWLRGK